MRDRGRAPAAGNKPAEEGVLGRLGIEVERLRIVLAREGLDRRLIERARAGGEGLADAEIVQIQGLPPATSPPSAICDRSSPKAQKKLRAIHNPQPPLER